MFDLGMALNREPRKSKDLIASKKEYNFWLQKLLSLILSFSLELPFAEPFEIYTARLKFELL